MRKIIEVLRLHSLGVSQRQIARVCSIGQSTVSEYLKQSGVAGVHWPDIAGWDEDQILAKLAPETTTSSASAVQGQLPLPEFAVIREELRSGKHVTLQLLWEEYQSQHPEGYRYSRFCELYQRWRGRQDVVMRQDHRPGEKVFVDYAGTTMTIRDPENGQNREAQLFLAVLGASSYTYAELTWTQQETDWIGSHVRAFEFFSGTPEIVVPDNLKSGVTRPCRYEPGINIAYEEMARHYGIAVIPARTYKPRDKAKVEAGVLVAERWILAALRRQTFFSIGAASAAVSELLTRMNDRPFKKREGSRRTVFEGVERSALRPLPAGRYEYFEWKKTRVNIDYHVEFDKHWYSVPYDLAGQEVEVRATSTTVEVLRKGRRVASHARSHQEYHKTSLDEHRAKSHRKYLEWTPSRIIDWAAGVGPSTGAVVEKILESNRHPEQGYRSCLGLIRLAGKYSATRLEAASKRALLLNVCSYRSIRSMLASQLDQQDPPVPDAGGGTEVASPLMHDNVRGAEYFASRTEEES